MTEDFPVQGHAHRANGGALLSNEQQPRFVVHHPGIAGAEVARPAYVTAENLSCFDLSACGAERYARAILAAAVFADARAQELNETVLPHLEAAVAASRGPLVAEARRAEKRLTPLRVGLKSPSPAGA